MTTYDPIEPSTELTTGNVLRTTVGTVWAHRQLLARTVWSPIVGLSLLMTVFDYYDARNHSIALSLAMILSGLASSFMVISFAITWRRFLVLGETPRITYFANTFWSYLGTALLVGLGVTGIALAGSFIVFVVVIAVIVGYSPPNVDPASLQTLALMIPVIAAELLACLPALWWGCRRAPVYTARALGNIDLTMGEASQAMRGHVLAYLGAMLPIYLVSFTVGMAFTYKDLPPLGGDQAARLAFVAERQAARLMEPLPVTFLIQLLNETWAFLSVALTSSIGTFFYVTLIQKRRVVDPV